MSSLRSLSSYEKILEMAVGIFFLAAMLILASYTIILKRGALFEDGHQRRVRFTSIGALQTNDRVVLRGMDVGKVAQLYLDKDGQHVIMTMDMQDAYEFHQGYVAQVRSSPILGGSYVYLELGDPTKPLVEAEILDGAPPVDPMSKAEGMISKAENFLDTLDSTLKRVDRFVVKVEESEGTLNKLIESDELHVTAVDAFKELQEAGTHIKTAADEVAGINTQITDAVKGFDDTQKRLTAAGESVESAGKAVEAAANNIDGMVTEAREGKGTLGKLLTDDKLYEDMQSTLADVRKLTDNMVEGESTLAKLLQDDAELYKDIQRSFNAFEKTMVAAQDVAERVNRGEGSLGKLVTDDELYNNVKDTVDEVKGAVRDMRETAPISTFGSLVFGAL